MPHYIIIMIMNKHVTPRINYLSVYGSGRYCLLSQHEMLDILSEEP